MSTRSTPGGAQPQPLTPPSRDVVHHVIGCPPCGKGLSALGEDENVLGRLGGRRPHDRILFVENVLSTAADVSRHRLGQLVYDMGRASLAMVPEVRREIEMLGGVSEFSSLTAQARALGRCMPEGVMSDSLDTMPLDAPTCESAIAVAESCAAVIHNLPWKPDRAALLRAYTALEAGHVDQAESLFRDLLDESTPADARGSAREGLVRAMLLHDRPSEAFRLCSQWIGDHAENPRLWFAWAMASAALHDGDGFDAAARGFSSIAVSSGQNQWWRDWIRDKSASIAGNLSRSEDAVLDALGFSLLAKEK